MKIKLSKSQWEFLGKKAGWIPNDISDSSDKDLGALYSPESEENALLGEEESKEEVEKKVYNDGLMSGGTSEDDPFCPYRRDSNLWKKWWEGFDQGKLNQELKRQELKRKSV